MDKLKAIQIQQAKPKEKPYKLFDGGGLFLDIRPNGSKYWRMKYRLRGKEKLYAIGVFPEITLKEAREKRDFARRQLREGIDPSAQKQIDKVNSLIRGENTFRVIAEDWFSTRMSEKSESHKKREQGLLNKYLYPTFGKMPLNEITSAQLLGVLRKIEANGHFETAKRVKQTAGQVFRFAISTNKADNDPSAPLRDALTPYKPKHRPAIIDPAQFGRLLLDIDHYQGSPVVMTALRLMPMLFCRSGELRHMEWEDINWQKQYWEMPSEKTKMREAHIVPLSKQALALLEKLQSIQTQSAFVFPNPRSAKKPMSDAAMLSALRYMGYDKDTLSVHGFRATARTLLDEELGWEAPVIERQLAHAVKDANGRAYNRTQYLKDRIRMMQAWSDYLDKLKRDALGIRVVASND